MNEIAQGVLTFIRSTDEHSLPVNARTRDVLKSLRAHLDATISGWRDRVFEENAVEVEVHLQGGRVVKGALVQRASMVRGEDA